MLESGISHLDITWLILPSTSVLSWSDLLLAHSGRDTFLLLVLTGCLQFGWFSVLFYQFLLQLRSLFRSCTQLYTLPISLLQTWGILVMGRKAWKVVCLWSPGDLQGLFLLSLSFQVMEEGRKEAALTGRFSQLCVLLAAVWVWWGLKVKQHNSRGVFLCLFPKYSYKKTSQVKLAERQRRKACCCIHR